MDHDIGQFEVSVNDVSLIKMGKSVHKLSKDHLSFFFCKFSSFCVFKSVKVFAITKFCKDVESVRIWNKEVQKFKCVLVIKLLKILNLIENVLNLILLLLLIFDI